MKENFLRTILTTEADNGNTPSNPLYSFLQTKNASFKSKTAAYGFGEAFFPPRKRIEVITRAFEIDDIHKTVHVKDIAALTELAIAYKEGDTRISVNKNIKKYALCLVLLYVNKLITEKQRKDVKTTLIELIDSLKFLPDDLAEMKKQIELPTAETPSPENAQMDTLKIENNTPISTGRLKQRKASSSSERESLTPTTRTSESTDSTPTPSPPTILITIGDRQVGQIPPLSPGHFAPSQALSGEHTIFTSPSNKPKNVSTDADPENVGIENIQLLKNDQKKEMSTVKEEVDIATSPSPDKTPNPSPLTPDRSLIDEKNNPDDSKKEQLIVAKTEHPSSQEDLSPDVLVILARMKGEGFTVGSIKLLKELQYSYFTREIKKLSLPQLEALLNDYMKTNYFNDIREETCLNSGRGNTRTWQNMCHEVKVNILAQLETQYHISSDSKEKKRPMPAEDYDKYYKLLNKHSDRLYFHFGMDTNSASLFAEKFERGNAVAQRREI
jgi:hypothetical protein